MFLSFVSYVGIIKYTKKYTNISENLLFSMQLSPSRLRFLLSRDYGFHYLILSFLLKTMSNNN